MDQHTVTSYRFAASRDDVALADGERFVAGGTWAFSEPTPDVTGLVDLTRMGWPPFERTPTGLSIAATCTIADVATIPAEPGWRAMPLFAECRDALLASWKIHRVATVGGNVVRAYAAASMVSLLVTLEAEAVIWVPGGGERRADVATLVAGNGVTTLGHGEVVRSFEIPEHALRATTACRKLALAELGRSGAVVTGRLDEDGTVTVVVTAATLTPRRLRYTRRPVAAALRADVQALPDFYTDPLGSQDWRRGVAAELAVRVIADLGEGA